MKKNIKNYLSMALVLMSVASISQVANAAEYTESKDTKYSEQVLYRWDKARYWNGSFEEYNHLWKYITFSNGYTTTETSKNITTAMDALVGTVVTRFERYFNTY